MINFNVFFKFSGTIVIQCDEHVGHYYTAHSAADAVFALLSGEDPSGWESEGSNGRVSPHRLKAHSRDAILKRINDGPLYDGSPTEEMFYLELKKLMHQDDSI